MAGKKKTEQKIVSEAALAKTRRDIADKASAEEAQIEMLEAALQLGRLAGRVETSNMFAKYGTVAGLVTLQGVKQGKLFKLVPSVGSWEKFCKMAGLDRRRVDEDLENLRTFGEEFLANVAGFGLGYHDLRKLRQIGHDGGARVTDTALEINGESIPLDADHIEDIKAAITEHVTTKEQEAADAKREAEAARRVSKDKEKHIHKLTEELSRMEKGLPEGEMPMDEAKFLRDMELCGLGFDGYLLKLGVDRLRNVVGGELTPRMAARYLSLTAYMKHQIAVMHDAVVTEFGHPDDEIEQWRPGMGGVVELEG